MRQRNCQMAIIRREGVLVSAVFRDQILDEVIVDELAEDKIQVGDIYIGKVSHVVQNINAAFLDVGGGQMCYLPTREKNSREEKIHAGMEFPVQIKKAAVKSKQPVVTRDVEISGRYAVVTMGNPRKSISAKITTDVERSRLQKILENYENEEAGIILRTNCQGAGEDIIREECDALLSQVRELSGIAASRTVFSRIYQAPPDFIKYLRDTGELFTRIITDVPEVYKKLGELQARGELNGQNLVFYEDESYSLDKLLGITSKLEKCMDKHVWLKSGASLVIEPTEALTVIDVNTEKAVMGKRNSETTFFQINCEAAREAARQIRVRNLSGIILIDFIDMKEKENERKLLEELGQEFARDKVRTTVVDITKLGIVEITRMKVRKPLHECAALFQN